MDNFFGFGGLGEFVFILFIALLVLGPEKIVGFARTLGKWVNKIKQYTSDVTTEITREVDERERALKEAAGSLKNEAEEQKKSVSQIANEFAGDLKSERKAIAGTANQFSAELKEHRRAIMAIVKQPATEGKNTQKTNAGTKFPVSKDTDLANNIDVAASVEKPGV